MHCAVLISDTALAGGYGPWLLGFRSLLQRRNKQGIPTAQTRTDHRVAHRGKAQAGIVDGMSHREMERSLSHPSSGKKHEPSRLLNVPISFVTCRSRSWCLVVDARHIEKVR